MIFILMAVGLSSCGLEDELDAAIIEISGEISNGGSAVAGALVLLIEGTNVSDGLNLSNASITDNRGRYTILNVDPGEYYLLAVDDSNGNLEFDAETDQLGFHGVNPSALDLDPDLIMVEASDIENVNVTSMYSL